MSTNQPKYDTLRLLHLGTHQIGCFLKKASTQAAHHRLAVEGWHCQRILPSRRVHIMKVFKIVDPPFGAIFPRHSAYWAEHEREKSQGIKEIQKRRAPPARGVQWDAYNVVGSIIRILAKGRLRNSSTTTTLLLRSNVATIRNAIGFK